MCGCRQPSISQHRLYRGVHAIALFTALLFNNNMSVKHILSSGKQSTIRSAVIHIRAPSLLPSSSQDDLNALYALFGQLHIPADQANNRCGTMPAVARHMRIQQGSVQYAAPCSNHCACSNPGTQLPDDALKWLASRGIQPQTVQNIDHVTWIGGGRPRICFFYRDGNRVARGRRNRVLYPDAPRRQRYSVGVFGGHLPLWLIDRVRPERRSKPPHGLEDAKSTDALGITRASAPGVLFITEVRVFLHSYVWHACHHRARSTR